ERLGRQTGDPEQVAEVRQHPRRGRLDELVVVELLQVLLEDRDLVGDHLEERGERLALLGVPDAVDRRQELVQPLRGVCHGSTSTSPCRRSIVSSSAGCAAAAASPALGEAARSRAWRPVPSRESRRRSTETTPGTLCTIATTSLSATGCPKARAAKENLLSSAASTAPSTCS